MAGSHARKVPVISQLLGVARVNFLSLTLVCIGVGAAAAWQAGFIVQPGRLLLVTCLGLCAHISVNAFNEYFDFTSGLDFLTQRTPFSGGSGTLISHPESSQLALTLALSTLLLLIGGGMYLTFVLGWQLLLFGFPGVVLIYAYTQYLNRWPWICLMAPGVGFGVLMTLGTYWVFAGSVSIASLVLAAIVTLLVSSLLLLNQFPDVDADRQVGRQHLPIVIGRPASARVFLLMVLSAFVLLIVAVGLEVLPWQCLLALLTLPILFRLIPGVLRLADLPEQLTPHLGLNVLLCHLFPFLLLIGLIWAV